ncbi:3-phosphoshikimate 1-carboxyvinyltransferase [Lactiplantibacillus plantarum]|uniref:3-phosphoshikimate 1-carboxyvinyltransferase n=1 Tax=Lactiplantibacillus plantarum CMPG5300 TaxID=1304889 RepID=A0AAW3FPK9_LACPN|nr:3-phosphoshikimate 1-carboxyvinyltransferase [Lactiplantibacillus plantarum]ATI71572.1 3-phosphoshikimate 1-carboxyvinyltransferase [Lactiplantibacillus plantarum]KGH43210.1 3-phosphoshikimate 1-carboxyvinyltransferase [Lactiplantibacillus plantarum CMPG5300]MCZ2138956.1 3-phosphoshikimate 1-carboxyvinyltransferase [Lactiplantibacillus plantarum]MCZ2275441.1 3-phosphoshikimate 1-carboxyvinyltransferase [Lactiplantibacillus plantarum]NSL96623.1 3-phosphoshikimate 1-carboxyvinyltransferase [L
MIKELSIQPTSGLHGELGVPGDKSLSHRGLILGAISQGTTTLHHFLPAADCLSTLTALQQLGVPIERIGTTVMIRGRGLRGLSQPQQALDMGNAGTATRLLAGLLAGQPFKTTLVGDASLSQRPMERVRQPLQAMGAQLQLTTGHLPMLITGRTLHGSRTEMQVASAQVKSALILAALQADRPSTIIEKLPTRDHTERLLRLFGGQIETAADHRTITVHPQPNLIGQSLTIPGDFSSAAFFMTAATIIPNSHIRLTHVGLNSTRTGFLSILQRMGGQVTVDRKLGAGEPVGTLDVRFAQLHPVQVTASEIPAVIDELPLVALLAATADGISTISGAAELRVKETDRIATIVTELQKLGVQITARPDGFVIDGRQSWQQPTEPLASHGDHRIGMMMAIAALRVGGPTELVDAEAVNISYPTFFEDLARLNQEV